MGQVIIVSVLRLGLLVPKTQQNTLEMLMIELIRAATAREFAKELAILRDVTPFLALVATR